MTWISILALFTISALLATINSVTEPSELLSEILFGVFLSFFLISLIWTPKKKERASVGKV